VKRLSEIIKVEKRIDCQLTALSNQPDEMGKLETA
jgi:hypothetical protein